MRRQGYGPHGEPQLLQEYISHCLPDPPVSPRARFSARLDAAHDGVDRISGLSDALLRDIVSRLPFKDAARTAVLASRWRRVWLAAPLAVSDDHLLDHWPPTPADATAVTAAVSSALAAHPGPFRCSHLVSTRFDVARQPLLERWLRLLAAKGVGELVLVNRSGPREVLPLPDTLFRIANLTCLYLGFWKFPRAALLQGASFPSLRELGICSVAVEDGDIDSLVARSPVLEVLNIQGSIKRLRLVGRSLRCVQICASVVESIVLVNTPCLDRLILWEVRGSPNPGGLRTWIRIEIAPKLCILGYLDPAQHLLEIGGTTITAGMKPSATTILRSVKVLSFTVCLGADGAMMVPDFLNCFPNVEELHIMSAKCDKTIVKLNPKFWQEAGPIVSVQSRIKVMTICEFRGEQHELAFLQFLYQNARMLKYAAIISANVRVTGISNKQMASIVQNMDDSRWACKFELAVLGTKGPEGGVPWIFQRGANFSEEDPFAPVKFIVRDSGKSVAVNKMFNGSFDTNQPNTLDIKHSDLAAGEELQPSELDKLLGRCDLRYKDLLQDFSSWSWEKKVVMILNRVRCRELTESDPKKPYIPTRFCAFNIAFFDLDKESDIKHEIPFYKIHPSKFYTLLDDSVNVISIRVAESELPVNIYGTVLARDENDFRCVYLFKRGRDDPQLITKKIKGKGPADQDFCKGMVVRNADRDILGQSRTFSLGSCQGAVDMVCLHVPFALEASVEVSFLNGKSNFNGKISAWTSGSVRNKITLYDAKVAGTDTRLDSGGSVSLNRRIIAVPLYEDLVLNFSVFEDHNPKHLELVLGPHNESRTGKLGSSELQVKILWNCIVRQRPPKMWKRIEDSLVLWS